MGALLGKPGGGAPLLGSLKVMKGTLLGNPKDEVFERYAKRPVSGPLSP